MGHRPRSPQHGSHRKGRACQQCIQELEIECGMRPPLPSPPRWRGAPSSQIVIPVLHLDGPPDPSIIVGEYR